MKYGRIAVYAGAVEFYGTGRSGCLYVDFAGSSVLWSYGGKNNGVVWTNGPGIIFPDKEKLLALQHGILYYKVNM